VPGGPPVETCNTGGGSPKYGDYNGNACAAGRFLTSFASAKSPPEIAPPSAAIDVFFTKFLVGNVPQIQVPQGAAFGDSCVGGTSRTTLQVCKYWQCQPDRKPNYFIESPVRRDDAVWGLSGND